MRFPLPVMAALASGCAAALCFSSGGVAAAGDGATAPVHRVAISGNLDAETARALQGINASVAPGRAANLGAAALRAMGGNADVPPPAPTVAPTTQPDPIQGPAPTLNPQVAQLLTPARLCASPSKTPVRDGQPIVVSLPPAPNFTVGQLPTSWWKSPPVKNETWRLWFWSSRWAHSLARRAHADGQTQALTAIVNQVLTFYTANPDAGRPYLGWAEGDSQRRLETLNCLYSMTRDARIPAAMAKEVTVQFSPRYFGPPNHIVHNHGLMANWRIMVAGLFINRPDWVTRARTRIGSELPLVFTPTGVSLEQSTEYHHHIRIMWRYAANLMTAINPADTTAQRAVAILDKADAVAPWFTEPDGKMLQIGDSERLPGATPPATMKPGLFRDDAAGLAIARWSTTNPNTTYISARYGPAKSAHGHFDKGAVTWTSHGMRIITDQGYNSYDPHHPTNPWHWWPEAHNIAIPTRGTLNTTGIGVLKTATFGRFGQLTMQDNLFGHWHTRTAAVSSVTPAYEVDDSMPRGVGIHQQWHLDPAWHLIRGSLKARNLIFQHPTGRTLTITPSTGTVTQLTRGTNKPYGGWMMYRYNTRTPAWQFRFTTPTNRMRTTFIIK